MSRTHTGFYREAWLVVAQGGWWKPKDILAALPPGVASGDPSNLLWTMATRYGYLKRQGYGVNVEYAVTGDCETPRGIPVARLMRALLVSLAAQC